MKTLKKAIKILFTAILTPWAISGGVLLAIFMFFIALPPLLLFSWLNDKPIDIKDDLKSALGISAFGFWVIGKLIWDRDLCSDLGL